MMRARQLLHRTTGIGLAICLLALTARAGDAAADPPSARCDKKNAQAAYVAGMTWYSERKCGEALPVLEEAAALCPVPPKDLQIVSLKHFVEYSYVPFFFLGNCHYKKNDAPEALRHFYLSSCIGEPARDKKKNTQELGPLTAQCRLKVKSQQRPEDYFSAGFAASEQKKWQKAAEKMWDALQVREEDGETTNSSGRWPDPYLPRFHLADVLFELGCPRQACEELGRSKLRQLREKRVEPERERMEKLLPLCDPKRLEVQREEEVCWQWRCWLGKGAP